MAANQILASNYNTDETFEVASLIIGLAQDIAYDLNPPAAGAERTVTKATVTDEGRSRTYYIEGKDVYHTGKVLSNYWIKLTKVLSAGDEPFADVVVSDSEVSDEPAYGSALTDETQRLIGPLLNGIYDIAELSLDHGRVVLEDIVEASSDPLVFEIVGVNDVCEHEDLNRFKLSIIRHFERSRPSYEIRLDKPFDLGTRPLYPIDSPRS